MLNTTHSTRTRGRVEPEIQAQASADAPDLAFRERPLETPALLCAAALVLRRPTVDAIGRVVTNLSRANGGKSFCRLLQSLP